MTQQDKFRIDSHKLIYHIPRVHDWLKGENIYPVYMEIGLFSGCNHRCVFCAFDYLRYSPKGLEQKELKKFIRDAAAKGVKSVMYAGEGEPFLHDGAADIIVFTKKSGLDTAVTTNGVMFHRETAVKTLGHLSWLRVSLDAGNAKTYSLIHKANKSDFRIVINNLEQAINIRDRRRYGCSIGAQFLLIPQNYNDAVSSARLLRDMGVDYMIVKPYSRHPMSGHKGCRGFEDRELLSLEEKLSKYSKRDFQIIFRRRAMERSDRQKPYKRCLGLPFVTYISAEGDIYPCSRFLGDKRFILGNILVDSFHGIWEGRRRKKVMRLFGAKWDIKSCRLNCRLDEINQYLWELKNPPAHVNFI
ncbi:MAG: radical SAM protein [Candidatus Omnitrophota bacterium]